MFFSLALKNVKRSFKNYFVYFLTLTLAVSIFYMFNSIESHRAVSEILSDTSKRNKDIVDMLTGVMGVISIFVAFIIGFLIIYANNFLIKTRKKEIGIYITLGLSKRKISSLIIVETIIIGIFALTIGLILGILLSQGFGAITSKFLLIELDKYKFIFSFNTMIKTIIYFSIMFVTVIIFNLINT